MKENLPALVVILPLLAAPLCLLVRRRRLVRVFALAVALGCLAAAAALLHAVLTGGTISYHLGGWAPPLGIEYRVEVANAYVLVLVSALAAVVLPFGLGRAGLALPPERHYLYYGTFLLCLAGLLGITVTGDAFNIFVFLEVSSLASYVLVSQGVGRRALTAAYAYLIMGSLGGTFFLIGVGLLYQMTGSLNLVDIAALLPEVAGTRTVLVSFAFLVIGIGIKLAVFPLHQWLPNAYTHAPSAVSAFLAATATKVMYLVLVRIVFTVFGHEFAFGTLKLDLLLLPLALAAMFMGSLAAVYQTDLKRLLAYSSIAQIGYMVLGLACGSELGLTGGLVHLVNHAVTKGGMFMAVAAIALKIGTTSIADLRGLGRRMPLTTAGFVLGGLGLIGVPATAGFISKWYLVLAALEKGWYWLAFLILASSLLAAVYVWRIVEVAYFQEPPEGAGRQPESLSVILPAWILLGASVVFGLWTDLTAGIARTAATQLMGALP